MGFWRVVWVVFRKEMLDGVRDRRSLLSTLLFPLLGPLMVTFAFTTVADRQREAGSVELAVAGAENAPALIDFLESNQVEVVELEQTPEEIEAAVESGERDFVLEIPEDFGERFEAAKVASVHFTVDGTRDETRAGARKVERLIQAWSGQMGSLRLIARGVDPQLVNPVRFVQHEVASEQQLAAKVLDFLPMFVIMAAFIGGMQLAVDATAGERERRSLEPLLINPVPREAIVIGKWAGSVVFASGAVILTLAGSLAAVAYAPLEELGISLDLGPSIALGIAAATVPMGFLASGLQLLVATFARSFKEAQSYLSLLMLVPLVPSFVASLWELGDAPWMIPVPALGQQVLLDRVMGGESVSFGAFAIAGASSLLLGLLCVAITARLFRRESIIFGR